MLDVPKFDMVHRVDCVAIVTCDLRLAIRTTSAILVSSTSSRYQTCGFEKRWLSNRQDRTLESLDTSKGRRLQIYPR